MDPGPMKLRHTVSHSFSRHPVYRLWFSKKTWAKQRGQLQDGPPIWEGWRTNSRAFCEWALANGWAPGLDLHRIDNNRGYEPDNCKFLTKQEHRHVHNCFGIWRDQVSARLSLPG